MIDNPAADLIIMEIKTAGWAMITRIRNIIAFNVSLLALLLSFGLIKPNFSGMPTHSDAADSRQSAITLTIDEDAPGPNRADANPPLKPRP